MALLLGVLLAATEPVVWPQASWAQGESAAAYRTKAITPERLRALSNYALANPRTTPVPWEVSAPLGLSVGHAPLTSRAMLLPELDGTKRVFAVDAADPTRLLIYFTKRDPRTTAGVGTFYRLNPDGELVAAVHVANRQVTPLSVNDPSVQSAFDRELALWVEVELGND